MNLDPNSIVVSDRQRTKPGDLDPTFVASVSKRLIHPIVIRRLEGDPNPVLVVGGRRLAAMIKAGMTELVEGIHFRYMDDLNPHDAKVVELEENVKREDLSWRDHVTAIGELHQLYKSSHEKWTAKRTAEELNIDPMTAGKMILIHKNLDSPLLRDATGSEQAYSILQIAAERRAASIVQDIVAAGNQIFNGGPGDGSTNQSPNSNGSGYVDSDRGRGDIALDSDSPRNPGLDSPTPVTPPAISPPTIICTNFIEWVKSYSGPKFNLIHCDFPFDIKYDSYAKSITSSATEDYDFSGFWPLTEALVTNLDRISSYSSHIMFWFSMKFYSETKTRLESGGLYVHEHPLIWHKTDNSGIIPGRDNAFPRRIYETAFLCSRGKRPLVKSLSNVYGAPLPSSGLHPSHKSEPMLRHFLSMLTDETTDFLDPTCGSGSAVRAADGCGARSVLGLEIDPNYAETARSTTELAQKLKRIVI